MALDGSNQNGNEWGDEQMKNYKVTSYRTYGRAKLGESVYYYDWYWVANLRSWFEHHFWGCDCNTFVRDGAKVKKRPVVCK